MDFTDVVDVLEEEYQQVILLLSIHHPVVNHPNKLLDEEIPAIHFSGNHPSQNGGLLMSAMDTSWLPEGCLLVFHHSN